ncbi:MAG: NAD(P)-binding protein [Bacteriovoracaceae bacterium]|nr:NAD(P)-binding protein [Bacteriovoracaceae bacterium]
MKNYVIIGAGLTGLSLAKKLVDSGESSVLVLEKSRGLGGRMATRRTLETRFDHGAQFYRLKTDSKIMHQFWLQNNDSHQWFISPAGDHWCAKEGMTSLAKKIAKGLDFSLEKQIQSIVKTDECWLLTSDKGEKWEAKNVILTAPLPQALLLLDKSEINYSAELKKIHYTKALIGLITLKSSIEISQYGYREFNQGDFFSLADQSSKGVSNLPALTLTMSPAFSEKYFDETDESIVLSSMLKSFKVLYPECEVVGSELKKWRYCQSLNSYEKSFLEVQKNFFLAGDAFGGSSLLGALRSSQALADFLIT